MNWDVQFPLPSCLRSHPSHPSWPIGLSCLTKCLLPISAQDLPILPGQEVGPKFCWHGVEEPPLLAVQIFDREPNSAAIIVVFVCSGGLSYCVKQASHLLWQKMWKRMSLVCKLAHRLRYWRCTLPPMSNWRCSLSGGVIVWKELQSLLNKRFR